MKSGVGGGIGISSYPFHLKKRWKGWVIAVLGLVVLSMVVPIVFIFGLHSGVLYPGLMPDDQNTVRKVLGVYTQHYSTNTQNKSKEFLDLDGNGSPDQLHQTTQGQPVGVLTHRKAVEENDICSEIRYGSYCLWHSEYTEDIKDSMVKMLKDLLFFAQAHFYSIAKLPAYDRLSRELKHNIQDFEHMLGDATSDADLPQLVEMKLQKMESAMSKVESMLVDCTDIDKKLRQLTDLIEDEAMFHMKQSAFLYQLTVQSTPKSLHCLSMRLTVEYFHSSQLDLEGFEAQKYIDRNLYHFVIFSNNILASSVVINSTVLHAKESGNLVFHVLTDRQNYFAMKLWFSSNIFKNATIRVLNIEEEYEHNLVSHLSLPEEFRVSFENAMRTEYLSLFSHSHYLLPEIFNNLDKIIILDDDIVVQQDLSALWSIDMEGKVNGAVELCAVKLSKISSYLGGNIFNQKSCAWMSGLNVVDLMRWRELDLTENFISLARELERQGQSEGVASRTSLLVFQDLVYALDGSWVLSGLGHDHGLSKKAISTSPVLHYNGNLKPWLELGIPKYKTFWTKYVDRQDQYLSECNVNP